MMSDIAIRVENLSKMYRIGRAQRRHDTLREALSASWQTGSRRRQMAGAEGRIGVSASRAAATVACERRGGAKSNARAVDEMIVAMGRSRAPFGQAPAGFAEGCMGSVADGYECAIAAQMF